MGAEGIDLEVFKFARQGVTARDLLAVIARDRRDRSLVLCGVESFQTFFAPLAAELYARADWILVGTGEVIEVKTRRRRSLDDFLADTPAPYFAHLGWEVGGFRETELHRRLEERLPAGFDYCEPVNEVTHPRCVHAFPPLMEPWTRARRDHQVKISLVILSGLGNASCLSEMLDSFRATTPPARDIEVIVVSNGSRDGTTEVAARKLGDDYRLTLIHWPENLGISGGFNEGIAAAKGQYVALLQDDLELGQLNWHREMAYYLDRYPDIGILGGHRAGYFFERPRSHDFEVPYWSPGSADWDLLKRAVVEVDSANVILTMHRRELGLYAEEYIPNGIEDHAFSFRARAAGWRVFATHVGVRHDMAKPDKSVTRRSYHSADRVHRLSRHAHYRRFLQDFGHLLRPLEPGATICPGLAEMESRVVTLPKDWAVVQEGLQPALLEV